MSYASVDLARYKSRDDQNNVDQRHPSLAVCDSDVSLETGREELIRLKLDRRDVGRPGSFPELPQTPSNAVRSKSAQPSRHEKDRLTILHEELLLAKSRGKLTGNDHERICVSFRDLSVVATKSTTSIIRKTWNHMSQFLDYKNHSTLSPRQSTISNQRHLLQNLHGLVQPGEMVLIIGRPGSGCSTFLKAMAGKLDPNCDTSGELMYSGQALQGRETLLARKSLYCSPQDIHIPTLTVQQTLDFSFRAKLPAVSSDGRQIILSKLLSIFGLSKQATTVVGDALLRGISGGEKKRLSIAEALAARPRVACWDNSTLGLDAGVALAFVKSIRILSDVYSITTFASLYQVSDTVYDLFDKVLVLEEGRQLYFGPASQARAYFCSLQYPLIDGQPVSEFLADCADFRTPKANRFSSACQLAQEYLNSDVYQQMSTEREEAARKQIAAAELGKDDPPPASICLAYHDQVWLTARRHALLRLQDKQGLLVKTITAVIISTVIGTVYWQQPQSSTGAFTRGGVIFITLLYNAFTAFVELPSVIAGRPLLRKQSSYGFFRPSACYLGQSCVDLGFASAEILIFSLIVYFTAGLARSAGNFFLFYCAIVLAQTIMTLIFRTMGCLAPTMDGALRSASILIIMMILTSGYMVPHNAITSIIRWFSWINPLAYDFAAMMANEFRTLDLKCVQQSMIPSGPSYSDPMYQVCTLPGALSGQAFVSGVQYLRAAFNYKQDIFWKNFGILFGFILGLLCINVLVGETIKIVPAGQSSVSHTREESFSKQNRLPSQAQPEKGLWTDDLISKSMLTWRNVNYKVPVSGGQTKQLLFNVNGLAEPGRLTALMGPSGAGKSTLLDVLAGRKTYGETTGACLVNGKSRPTNFARTMGYCEQLDICDPQQTVREALVFSALLRQPSDVSRADKIAFIDRLIVLLGLDHISNALVGDGNSGISEEDRKRVSIGVELAAKPTGLIFLDEPTSGLDSQSALSIVRLLREIANSGIAIICTIHQPSAALFEIFDDLLLLQHGKTVFSGPTRSFRQYLESKDASPPRGCNIAEFALQILVADSETDSNAKSWTDKWAESREAEVLLNMVHEHSRVCMPSNKETRQQDNAVAASSSSHYSRSSLYQCCLVSQRATTSCWRLPGYASTRIFTHLVVALLTGLTYLNIGNSAADLQYRVFVIFQVTVLPSMVLSQVQARYHAARTVAYRETTSRMYSPTVFVLAQIVSELPLSLLCAVVFYLPLYYCTGFHRSSTYAGYQFLIIYLTETFSVALGQAVAALTPSTYIASLFTPFLLITLSLFCGVTVPVPQIPKFYRVWLYRINPFSYLVGGMIATEMHQLVVQCSSAELHVFQPPPGRTCGDYAEAFLNSSSARGYLTNPAAVRDCAYCPYRGGDAFAAQFGLHWDSRWLYLGVMAVFCVSTTCILFVAGTRLRFMKR